MRFLKGSLIFGFLLMSFFHESAEAAGIHISSRPEQVGLYESFILEIDLDEGIIRVPYIDAEDGTPVIDLKPYQPCVDRIRDVSVPEWCDHWPKWYEDAAEFDWESEFTFDD